MAGQSQAKSAANAAGSPSAVELREMIASLQGQVIALREVVAEHEVVLSGRLAVHRRRAARAARAAEEG